MTEQPHPSPAWAGILAAHDQADAEVGVLTRMAVEHMRAGYCNAQPICIGGPAIARLLRETDPIMLRRLVIAAVRHLAATEAVK